MLKEFETTISSYNDPRLKKLSWYMHSDPTEEGKLEYFDDNNNLVPIPRDAPILGTLRPKANVKLINLPIAIGGHGLAEDCERETYTGYITFPLRIKKEGEHITFLEFLKAIYDFYHYPITETDYKHLIHLKKKKDREEFFNELKFKMKTKEETKALCEHFAGSMYFEGYDYRSRSIEYGT